MSRYQRIRQYVRYIMTFTAGLWMFGAAAFAQVQYGSVSGRAMDKDGGVLPGVTVTLTGVGAPQTFVTDSQGQYRFLGLAPGNYTLSAELEGFGRLSRPVEVTLGNNAEIDFRLSPAVNESITVSAATPMIDRRQTGTAANIQEIELEKVPTARDPWVLLQSVPGVLVDRVNVGGNKSGQQSYFVGKGVERNQTTWNLDGVNVADMQATGSSGFYYDFDSFQEFNVTTGNTDASVQTPGVQINMVTKRGTNQVRGSGRYFWTDKEFQADPVIPAEAASYPTPLAQVNSINNINEYGAEAGGPLMRDRLWLWGAYSSNHIDNLVPGTNSSSFIKTTLKNYNGKLNAQPLQNNAASAYYMYSDKVQLHRGISLTRPVETSWNQSGPGWVWKFEDTHNFSNSLYATAKVGLIHNGYQLDPVGGRDTNVYWDNQGSVPHGSYRFYSQKVPQKQYRVDGAKFFNAAKMNHELKFGFGYRNTPVESVTAWPGDKTWVEFYRNAADNRVAITRDAFPRYGSNYTDLYVGDTILVGNLTINGGLRYDLQKAKNRASEVAANPAFPDIMPALSFPGDKRALEWKSLSPRLGVTYALGADRRTLVRGGYSRYVDQLGSGQVGPNNPLYVPQILYFYWTDANNDKKVQRNEIGKAAGKSGNIDPAHPASPVSTGRVDYDMDPTKTDEFTLGIEREMFSAFSVGVNATYRKRSDFVWSQYEKTQGAGDYYTTADYGPAASTRTPVTGTLPDGTPYSIPVYRVKAGIPVPTFTVSRNRPDYEQTYKGLELVATKRLEHNWMVRGNLTLTDWTQHVGPGAIVDPTILLTTNTGGLAPSCFSCPGTSAVGSASGEDGFINSRWAAALNGLYQFPHAFSLGAAITARDGYIIPYHRRVSAGDGTSQKRVLIGDFDDHRLPNLYQLDLRLAKDIATVRGIGLTVSADLFNATNRRTILWRDYRMYTANGADLTAGNNNILEMQSPRIWRFGARLNF